MIASFWDAKIGIHLPAPEPVPTVVEAIGAVTLGDAKAGDTGGGAFMVGPSVGVDTCAAGADLRP